MEAAMTGRSECRNGPRLGPSLLALTMEGGGHQPAAAHGFWELERGRSQVLPQNFQKQIQLGQHLAIHPERPIANF